MVMIHLRSPPCKAETVKLELFLQKSAMTELDKLFLYMVFAQLFV